MRQVDAFTRRDGTTTYRVRFRLNGKHTTETFAARPEAERFTRLLKDLGAQAALDQIYDEDRAADVPTLDEYAARHIASLTRITDGTRTSYSRIYKRSWSDRLGSRQLHRIDRHEVAAVINAMVAEGKADKTIANAHGLLAGIMKGAVIDGHISRSPCTGIKLPRSSEHHETEHRYLTHAEFQVLRAAMSSHFVPLLDTLVGTGIRWGEAEALQVKAIDFRASTMRITQSAKWDASRSQRTFGPPKTKKSRRTIALPPEVTTALLPLVEGKRREDLIFTMPRGGQLRHATFHHRYWVPAVEAADLIEPRLRIHDCRHSHAAWLLSAGVPIAVLQARLGHESITTTVDTYGHLLPETQVAAAEAASLVFGSAPKAITS